MDAIITLLGLVIGTIIFFAVRVFDANLHKTDLYVPNIQNIKNPQFLSKFA